MRCDLHVHTLHSGMCSLPLLKRVCRESYNDPRMVYEILKARGMDLVTVTDHDSIDAAESLRSRPDFFLSEEVTALTPARAEIHIGVYGIDDARHRGLQSRRDDFVRLIAYLNEQKLLFSVNHAFSGLTGRRAAQDFSFFADRFPAVETLNGCMLRCANGSAAAFATEWRKVAVGGSDAHTTNGLGRTYTEVPGSLTAQEFLHGLRMGQGRAHGQSGSYAGMTRAIWSIGFSMMREKPLTASLAPLLLLVPFVTLGNVWSEAAFNYRWSRRARRGRTSLSEPGCIADFV